mgnify:CR=1 FL=1
MAAVLIPGIRGIIQSDTEARTALRTAMINEQTVFGFEDLGLLRLLYAADPEKRNQPVCTGNTGAID